MNFKNRALILMALAACASPTLAAEGFRPLLGATITGGGETLATVLYTDGSTQEVRSGGLVHLFAGIEYQGAGFAVQANVGHHVDDTSGRNGSVKFARVPVELLGFWRVSDSIRLGGRLAQRRQRQADEFGCCVQRRRGHAGQQGRRRVPG